MEFAAGEGVLVIVASANSNQLVYLIVIVGNIFVSNGPGNFPPVLGGPFEVYIGVAERNSAPNVGFAAATPHSDQLEGIFRIGDIGLFFGVDEELGRLHALLYPVPPLPWLDVGPKLGFIEFGARVQHQDVYTLSGQVPRCHATRGTTADNDDIVNLRTGFNLHGLDLVLRMGTTLEFGEVGVSVPA